MIEEDRSEEMPETRSDRKGGLKNDDLEKKRKELEQKSKNRKAALGALKKEK